MGGMRGCRRWRSTTSTAAPSVPTAGSSSPARAASPGPRMCCHCLLIETGDALVLVDTGFGADDVAHPHRRLGVPFTVGFRPRRSSPRRRSSRSAGSASTPPTSATSRSPISTSTTPADCRTSPTPRCTCSRPNSRRREPERCATAPAIRPPLRPRPELGRRTTSTATAGSASRACACSRASTPRSLLIPLLGHSRGHSAIAVRDGDGWILHCGDAYFFRDEVADARRAARPGCARFRAAMAADNSARVTNQARLRELARDHGDEVRLFCSHDPVELEREQAR